MAVSVRFLNTYKHRYSKCRKGASLFVNKHSWAM